MSGCSARVVFPSLGRTVDLPPFEDDAVELPALSPGRHPITCPRGVLYRRIIVRNFAAQRQAHPAGAGAGAS